MARHPEFEGDDVPLTRRGMPVGALATGFALAVRPVSAATITTGTDGLAAGEVRIPTARSRPASAGASASRGCMPPTIRASGRASHGTGAWSASLRR